jgi:hypothetical protein
VVATVGKADKEASPAVDSVEAVATRATVGKEGASPEVDWAEAVAIVDLVDKEVASLVEAWVAAVEILVSVAKVVVNRAAGLEEVVETLDTAKAAKAVDKVEIVASAADSLVAVWGDRAAIRVREVILEPEVGMVVASRAAGMVDNKVDNKVAATTTKGYFAVAPAYGWLMGG